MYPKQSYKLSNPNLIIMSLMGVCWLNPQVFIMCSMDWKLGWMGGESTYPHHRHPVPQEPPLILD